MSNTAMDTQTQQHGPSIERLEVFLGNLLRLGVLLSFLIIIVGVVITVAHHPGFLTDHTLTHQVIGTGNGFPRSLGELFKGLVALQGRSIIIFGLMLLILTPVFRVAASIVAFALQRDWIYTLMTLAVLLILLISFLLGKAE